jgi:nitrogen fixation protein NifU and related proteins
MLQESHHPGHSLLCAPAHGDAGPLCGHPALPNFEEIYPPRIESHCEAPYHRGRCSRCTHAHEDTGPLCGDTVRLELRIDERGTLSEMYFDGDGCCISQAAASMLVERFDGKRVDDIKRFTAQDMLDLFGVRLTQKRQKCCLLSWRVLQTAICSPVRGNGASQPRSLD